MPSANSHYSVFKAILILFADALINKITLIILALLILPKYSYSSNTTKWFCFFYILRYLAEKQKMAMLLFLISCVCMYSNMTLQDASYDTTDSKQKCLLTKHDAQSLIK